MDDNEPQIGKKDNTDGLPKNLRNSVAVPTMGAAGGKSQVQNVNVGSSDKDMQEMDDEDFSDDGEGNLDKTAPTKKSWAMK